MTLKTKIKSYGKLLFKDNYNSSVFYKGFILPPVNMRFMGKNYENNENYLLSSLSEGKRLVKKLGVNKDTIMLEIGCCTGRTVIGLINETKGIKTYIGCDIKKNNIDWCNKFIAKKYRFCQFKHLDLYHPMYNTHGSILLNSKFKFPFKENYFSLIYLNSIFGNASIEEIEAIAKESRRMLISNGRIFFTAFAEENVPNCEENPKNYIMEAKYPRHIMRYDKDFLIGIFKSYNFILNEFDFHNEIDFQSGFYFSIK